MVRLLLNSAMLLGSASGGEAWWEGAVGLLNRSYCHVSSGEELSGFLCEHFTQDWRSLKTMTGLTDDDLATACHVMLVKGHRPPAHAPHHEVRCREGSCSKLMDKGSGEMGHRSTGTCV